MLAVSLLGVFSVGFTITLLAVTLPTIADDFGTEESTFTWLITGPTLAFGLIGPAFGKLGDLWGHKRVALLGLAGAGVFALATALAWNPASVIAFRIIGAGLGAATGPAALALLNTVFAPAERVRALGWWNVVGAGGPVLGAVLGAPIVETVGWRVVFLAQAPLCAIAAVVALVKLPETGGGRRSRFDVPGAVTLALAITSLLFALNRGQPWGWTHPVVLGGLALAPALGATFVAVERRSSEPLFPLHYVRRRNVVAPMGVQALANMAYMGGFALTPLMLDRSLGFTATHITMLVIFRPLAFSITGPVAGAMTVRMGERRAAMGGTALIAASMVCLSFVRPGTGEWFIALGLALSGVGMGTLSPAMGAAVANAVDDGDLGVAGAMQQMFTQVGAAAGIQLMQTVQAIREDATGDLAGSYMPAYLAGGAVVLGGVLVAALVRSGAGRTPPRLVAAADGPDAADAADAALRP
jgi:MFS family permease